MLKILLPPDLQRTLHAALSLPPGRRRSALLILTTTPLRCAEIASLTLAHLRGDLLTVRAKGGALHLLPLHPAIPPLLALDDLPLCSTRTLQRWARSLLAALDLPLSQPCHGFRHSLATAALLAGAPLESIQRALGHRAISTTARYLSQAAALVAPAHLLVVAHLIAKEDPRALSPKPIPLPPTLPGFDQISLAKRSA